MSAQRRQSYQFMTPGSEPSGMDAVATERARAAIEKLKLSYLTEWAPATIDELDRRLQLARSVPSTAPEHLEAAFRLAHDMKGQGSHIWLRPHLRYWRIALRHDTRLR